MHDGIAIGERVHPRARRNRIAADNGAIGAGKCLALRAARKHHDVIAALAQFLHQKCADQTGAAGHEDAHGVILSALHLATLSAPAFR